MSMLVPYTGYCSFLKLIIMHVALRPMEALAESVVVPDRVASSQRMRVRIRGSPA